jgi:hypothetical protein
MKGRREMRAQSTAAVIGLSAAALVSWIVAAPARADAISDWNAKAEIIATEKGSSALSRAQGLAILHVAMFEAMNALELQNDADKPDISADQNPSVEAAAATAAYAVLVALHRERAADLSSALALSLAKIANGVPKARGHVAGKKAAAAVLEQWFLKNASILVVHPLLKN